MEGTDLLGPIDGGRVRVALGTGLAVALARADEGTACTAVVTGNDRGGDVCR